ncbi:MAG: tRNA uridine-5-carboxymethylaminomethyl(34) synthesis GTPase MnmE [Lentisphaeria bacterium]|nr:tRNA uridine-5-carboxymethylaminomethyl(34) synthesis GTPase MnmE [Lentisphaeria bacterium]
MNTRDNIAAPASAVGGAITVIRVSGPDALRIGNAVWHGRRKLAETEERRMLLGRIGGDPTLAVFMKGPRSYTGDDVVELQCHGGAAAAAHAMRQLLTAGCRLAEPGEFTYRAFVNGKLDLLQAEAVADMVSSGSQAALDLAARQLEGALSRAVNSLWDDIASLRAECESRLDFPDEELDFDPDVPDKIADCLRRISALLASGQTGALLRDGVRVVLAGKPNVGKSSLLNRILGRDRAIVSAIPGTTRDTVESETVIHGIPVQLTDTAGLRESSDPVEQLGIERTRRSIRAGEVTLWLLDASAPDPAAEVAAMDRSAPGVIAVWNKCDLAPEAVLPDPGVPQVKISAATGENMEALFDAVEARVCAGQRLTPPEVAVNARGAALLEQAQASLLRAKAAFEAADHELAALELAAANRQIGGITGKNVEPDLLDRIFHRFCIGK